MLELPFTGTNSVGLLSLSLQVLLLIFGNIFPFCSLFSSAEKSVFLNVDSDSKEEKMRGSGNMKLDIYLLEGITMLTTDTSANCKNYTD